MIVLGVDPGSRITGYGILQKKNNVISCVASGTIESSGNIPFYDRIYKIFTGMVDIMEEYQPDEMAIEDVFYAKNIKSSLKLGHARGAALIAAVKCNVRIYEYTPLEIKQSVVGYGRATKDQVRTMIQMILNLPARLGPDTSDAIAAAICHLNWTRYEKKK
ncbi:MAG: crossover junction endodeoxyribonuclease RuvC [Desulfobacteraceae bacterium]|jgi:crossover junction endodeoxyribonuclease RuvC